MDRRSFLHSSALMAATTLLPESPLWAADSHLDRIGIQLFSLPKLLEQDFRRAIGLLAEIGYRELELYGPYPFSAKEAVASWQAVTPSLGFSGSGYFGLQAHEVKAVVDDNDMSIPAVHTDLVTLQRKMDALGEAADGLGFEYAGLPAIPGDRRKTLDDYKRMADEFNVIGEQAKKVGLKFSYHNHGYGLQEMEGEIPLNVILERTDPGLVFFEMDIFWTVAGGADPVAYLKAYPGRYHLMHVKDMKEKKHFSGDGGTSDQWIELFPVMTTAGDGVLDLKAIVEQALQSGVQHFYVEQDMVANPAIALKRSFDYMRML